MATTQAPSTNQNQTLTIASSDFSYEPPQVDDTSAEFNQSLKDIVAEIEGEYNPAPEFEDTPAEGVEGEATVEEDQEAPEGEAPAGSEVEKDDPAIARGIERIVQREVAVQAREAKLQASEARYQALERENLELRGRLPDKNVTEMMGLDPLGAMKAMGHDPDHIVSLAIAQKLKGEGKEIPPALAKKIADAEGEIRYKRLEAKMAERDRADQSAAYFNAVALGAREYVGGFKDSKLGVGLSKTLPTIAALVKSDADRVHGDILEEITKDARDRAARDPNGEPLTFEEAAKRVEAKYAAMKALLVPTNATANSQAPGAAKSPTPPKPKPPTKPIRPWEQKNDVEQQGLNEAIREFHKLEGQRKAKR